MLLAETTFIELTNSQKFVIELFMAITILLSLITIIIRSIWAIYDKDKTTIDKDKSETTTKGHIKGIGARTIQFASIFLIIPALVILGIEHVINGEVIAAILATMAGFLLSGIGDYDKTKGND